MRGATLGLAAGAALGLAAAGAALVASGRHAAPLPRDAVAVVNGTPVRSADYERAVAALASDRRSPIGDAERRLVLDRLVDQELLVQRALELGLARDDRRVRNDLVSALIDSVVIEASDREPDDGELRAFYDGNRDWFAEPGRVHVRQLWVRGAPARPRDEAQARAREAAARLRAGEPFEAVEAALGDAPVAPLPDAPLPTAKLAEYLGAAAPEALRGLGPGGVSEPLPAPGGLQVLVLVGRADATTPPFGTVADRVRAEWRRRAGDEALRRYLDDLRSRSEIRVAGPPSPPSGPVGAGGQGR